MKILHMTIVLSNGMKKAAGATVHNASMKKAFSDLGHEVISYPISPSENVSGSGKQIDFGMQYKIYSRMKQFVPKVVTDWAKDAYTILSVPKYYKNLNELFADSKPDFIYERFCHFNDAGVRFATENKIPYVTEMHVNFEERRFYQKANFESHFIKNQLKIARMADAVVVVSGYLKDYLVECGIDANKVLVVHNAADVEIFKERGVREEIRKKYGIEDNVVVGFVGTMRWFHGLEHFPSVCERIKKHIPNINMILVGGFGNEEERQKMLSEIREKDLESNFTFTGRVPLEDVPGLMEAMDICFAPQAGLHYGSPIKMFEYGAMGKAVLMPDHGPIQEIIRPGENGLLFKKGNLDDMVEKIVELAGDKALREKLGRRFQQEIIEKHTWKINTETILKAVFG